MDFIYQYLTETRIISLVIENEKHVIIMIIS